MHWRVFAGKLETKRVFAVVEQQIKNGVEKELFWVAFWVWGLLRL
jgi:hypothetical protein